MKHFADQSIKVNSLFSFGHNISLGEGKSGKSPVHICSARRRVHVLRNGIKYSTSIYPSSEDAYLGVENGNRMNMPLDDTDALKFTDKGYAKVALTIENWIH